jgi:hypothetical protein
MMMAVAMPQAAAHPPRVRTTTPARRMDKSSQGLKRAIAEAVARLLKIQPGIYNTVESSKRPVARV